MDSTHGWLVPSSPLVVSVVWIAGALSPGCRAFDEELLHRDSGVLHDAGVPPDARNSDAAPPDGGRTLPDGGSDAGDDCARACPSGVCHDGGGCGEEQVVEVAAGGQHTCALMSSGSVLCWGSNGLGQLGRGARAGSAAQPVPGLVTLLRDASAIGAAGNHACALRRNGAIVCWGANERGEVGSPDIGVAEATPFPVPGIDDAVALSVGYRVSCALRASGTVACWGDNSEGQLGIGPRDPAVDQSSTPMPVVRLTDVAALELGYRHACAVTDSDAVWCWGANFEWQLGREPGVDFIVPTPVEVDIAPASDVSGGGAHSCALLRDGDLSCWGFNGNGELGVTTTGDRASPITLAMPTDVTDIATGGLVYILRLIGFTCALSDGRVSCWGWNETGTLGDGTTTSRTTPSVIAELSGVTQISAGNTHACALTGEGRVWCWGRNESGELGTGTLSASEPRPVAVTFP